MNLFSPSLLLTFKAFKWIWVHKLWYYYSKSDLKNKYWILITLYEKKII